MKGNYRAVLLAFLVFGVTENLFAQDFVQVKNRWRNTFVHNQNGPVEAGPIQTGWWSAQWILEPVAGTEFVKIKNRWRGTYLHNQNGPLEIGDIQPGWWSAQWKIESVDANFIRIKNRWKNTFIHNQNGPLELGDIQPGWWSAMWAIESVKGTSTAANNQQSRNTQQANKKPATLKIPGTNQVLTVDQLKSDLAKGGLQLVQTKTLQPNQCALIYPNADKKDLSAEFGLLTCATKINDNVTLNSTAVYGGCDASDPMQQGAGVRCEVGVASQNVNVAFSGGNANFDIKGPTASGCGSVSSEALCANAGTTLASTSFTVTDARGNGVGIGVSAGIGAGLDGGYEDGIISGSVNLKFIAGGSLSFSVNAKDASTTILKAGKSGYVLANRTIVGASNEIKNAYSRELPNVKSTTGKVVKVASDGVEFIDGTFSEFGKDAGQYMATAVVDVSNWVSDAAKGKKPRKLKPGEGYLSVFNQAGYVSEVSASFYVNGKKHSNKERISAGFTKEFYFPPGSTDIKVTTEGIGTMDDLNMKLSFKSLSNQQKCYKCWGTIFDVEWGSISCK